MTYWWLIPLVVGRLAWPFVEYLIHGILSHRLKTFVSPMHWGHHKNPHNVFTSPVAWVPISLLLWGIGTLLLGLPTSSAFIVGLLLGFLRYEYLHWRLHFRAPRHARERQLRAHHLAHHFCNPKMYHGVTTRMWDRVFGTLPADYERDYARVVDRPLLTGKSNLGMLWPRPASRDG
jgi:dihydroceramide fatty acyl 2-hydroxylase